MASLRGSVNRNNAADDESLMSCVALMQENEDQRRAVRKEIEEIDSQIGLKMTLRRNEELVRNQGEKDWALTELEAEKHRQNAIETKRDADMMEYVRVQYIQSLHSEFQSNRSSRNNAKPRNHEDEEECQEEDATDAFLTSATSVEELIQTITTLENELRGARINITEELDASGKILSTIAEEQLEELLEKARSETEACEKEKEQEEVHLNNLKAEIAQSRQVVQETRSKAAEKEKLLTETEAKNEAELAIELKLIQEAERESKELEVVSDLKATVEKNKALLKALAEQFDECDPLKCKFEELKVENKKLEKEVTDKEEALAKLQAMMKEEIETASKASQRLAAAKRGQAEADELCAENAKLEGGYEEAVSILPDMNKEIAKLSGYTENEETDPDMSSIQSKLKSVEEELVNAIADKENFEKVLLETQSKEREEDGRIQKEKVAEAELLRECKEILNRTKEDHEEMVQKYEKAQLETKRERQTLLDEARKAHDKNREELDETLIILKEAQNLAKAYVATADKADAKVAAIEKRVNELDESLAAIAQKENSTD